MEDYESSEEYIVSKKRLDTCKIIKDKEEKIDCMFKLLYSITRAQDITNISIIKAINNDEDPRWIPSHMVDNANAIILGISQHKAHAKQIVPEGGYVDEKMDSLNNKWFMLKMKHRR